MVAKPTERTKGEASLLGLATAWLPILSVVIASLWGLFTYLRNEEAAGAREATTRRIEAQQPFLKLQLDRYNDTAEVIGLLVNGTSDQDAAQAKAFGEAFLRFERLYWSQLAMVEDRGVETTMVAFNDAMRAYRAALAEGQSAPAREGAKTAMSTAALNVAHAMRSSLEAQWK